MNAIESGSFPLGDKTYNWESWDGQKLGKYIALDTETTLIEGADHIPKLCLVSLSDGERHYVAEPAQLPQILEQHLKGGGHIVFHNVAFDFWVIDQYLSINGKVSGRNWLWHAVDQGRVHDTMILAALVTLAQSDNDRMLSLGDATQRWCGYTLEKDVYRLRYAEILNVPWNEVEHGFFEYAVADAIATWQLFTKLTHAAKAICEQHSLPRNHGFLTESVQVKAAIGLSRIKQNGMHVDLDRLALLRDEIDTVIRELVAKMREIEPTIWKLDLKNGKAVINRTTGIPSMVDKVLRKRLESIAVEHDLDIPYTPTNKISASVGECWAEHQDLDLFVEAFCKFRGFTKLRAFFKGLQQTQIHPEYRTLVKTGRTSCSKPNIQQLPAKGPIRDTIAARPGHLFFIIDYNSLELRTLAAVCESQIGNSKLREILIQEIDPHSYTAAMFAGKSLEEFGELPDKKQLRQRAKVFNFGIPAGFGATSLVHHAKFNYGVEISLDEARLFIHKLTREVYPELEVYLREDVKSRLAAKLNVDVIQVHTMWPEPYQIGSLGKILKGNPTKADGTPYHPYAIEKNWESLLALNKNPELEAHIRNRNTSIDSPLQKLLTSPAPTLTGRIRGEVRFTAAKNTPFQGLAADGCKLALWELTKAGYRVVAFIHDEFIIELKADRDLDQAAADINRIWPFTDLATKRVSQGLVSYDLNDCQ